MKTFKQLTEDKLREKELEEAAGRLATPNETIWKTWKKLVNLSAKELQEFLNSEEGIEAGRLQAPTDDGVDSGRESARMIVKMLPLGQTFEEAKTSWSPLMWWWASKQVTFVGRMKSTRRRMVGNPFERNGKKTRWYLSLLLWGHDPKKR